MAVTWLRRLASAAPVPVFPAVGAGARWNVTRLRGEPGVELTASPRHASVLLVAGAMPPALFDAAVNVHDQLPPPRGVVRWADDGGWPGPHVAVPAAGDVVTIVQRLHADLMTGARDGAPELLPADHPVDWQGVGPYGHGGEGMMGGTPYGRPLPMPPTEGRDGLALDRLPLTFGPHLAGFPPGLVLHVGLQGDVLESVEVGDNPFTTDEDDWDGNRLAANASLATSREGLLRLADLLALAGTPDLARRAVRLATSTDDGGDSSATTDAATLAAFRRRLERTTTLRWLTRGVGRTEVTGVTSDARDRWRAWLDDDDRAAASDAADLSGTAVAALPDLLIGMEWGAALATIATLPLDLERAADRVPSTAP